MVRIAVTGGIACGKSLAASYMEASGVAICEADALVHALYAPGTDVHRRIVEEFGSGVQGEGGGIDRVVLGERVFGNEPLRLQLNRLVHPAVAEAIAMWLAERERTGTRMAAVVIPLLFEADMHAGWDAIVCVGSSPELQMERLAGRGFDAPACRARLKAQMPVLEKAGRSDYVVWNNGSPEALGVSVREVLRSIEEKEGVWKRA